MLKVLKTQTADAPLVVLPAPGKVKAQKPVPERARRRVNSTRQAIRGLIHGRDMRRLLVIVGPCSIHDPEAACAYATRLKRVAEATRECLVIVMRAYFEKPRTILGWKGLIRDPHLDASHDIAAGLSLARHTLLTLNAMGVGCGSELLDPVTPPYLADLLSWAAIGARTSESQTHREMASGLDLPVGFKNGTAGNLEGCVNALISARHPHSLMGINEEGIACAGLTRGNPDGHIVLRGGAGGANYDSENVARIIKLLDAQAPARPVMIDCSHGNSGKDHHRQGSVCRAVLRQVRAGQAAILGFCLESNLYPGRQDWNPGVPLRNGVSITDACIGWSETEELLLEAAEAVKETQGEGSLARTCREVCTTVPTL